MKFISASYILFFFIFSSHAQNYVSTFAGDGTNGYADGDTATAKFKGPFGLCMDDSGNFYIADNTDHRIRKIAADGIVSTLAGTGVAGYLDGPGSAAKFNAPSDLCVDDAGNVYVSDFQNQYIRKIAADGTVTTIAGNGIAGYLDGVASVARFNYPRGICIDAQGNLFIADSWNHRIRKIDGNGNVSTLAGYSDTIGVQSPGDYADGSDTSARFNVPCGMSIDSAGNLYLADAYNHRIRKITPAGVVTTVAGSGPTGVSNGGFLDGAVDVARLNTPTEVFIDQEGELFIADTYNNRIRSVKDNEVSTIAGNGDAGFVNGVDTLASFNTPRGLVTDATGKYVYVCDNANHVIRKISIAVTTGIAITETRNKLVIFPNPTTGQVSVTLPGSVERILVTDFFGRVVLSNTPECYSSPRTINLEDLPNGIYVLTFFTDDKELTSAKLMITH